MLLSCTLNVVMGGGFMFLYNLGFQDYAMETDETRIRNAAHLMVASLAGSLAHVTCKVNMEYLF